MKPFEKEGREGFGYHKTCIQTSKSITELYGLWVEAVVLWWGLFSEKNILNYSYYDELYETSLVKYSSLFKNCLVILAHGIKWNGLFYLKKSMVTKNFVLDSSQK